MGPARFHCATLLLTDYLLFLNCFKCRMKPLFIAYKESVCVFFFISTVSLAPNWNDAVINETRFNFWPSFKSICLALRWPGSRGSVNKFRILPTAINWCLLWLCKENYLSLFGNKHLELPKIVTGRETWSTESPFIFSKESKAKFHETCKLKMKNAYRVENTFFPFLDTNIFTRRSLNPGHFYPTLAEFQTPFQALGANCVVFHGV